MKKIFLTILLIQGILLVQGQALTYPHTVHFITLTIEQQPVKMAYMDVKPANANGKSVLLLHGKNFNGFYWKDVIAFLSGAGYRVIVPDQVGWGFSDKPDIHYSFHVLADNTRQLLDTLGIKKVSLLVHSMGGMLGSRFVLMYPSMVDKLIYENPIGLEDYKTFVPYHSVDEQFASEMKATRASLKKYQQSYYPEWKEAYEPYVDAQYAALQLPDFKSATWASALTYQMIYEQPVVYELQNIRVPTLIIIGQADRTIVGKNLLNKETIQKHGQYPLLGKQLQQKIRGSKLVELKGVGHIPHVQAPTIFKEKVLDFLKDR
ncbi:MAG TPA: alpha/beta hydrolase [Flavisolibacter sp.]|nr:alpha/beta hydrolase [Flavisolibacter sp.]